MQEDQAPHRSGFINIIGHPNVGKSTLMNALVGERMSIITNKPQTTRHRIIGIVSTENAQMVFSDTPGYISDPSYKMQEKMNTFVKGTFEDADAIVFVWDGKEPFAEEDYLYHKLEKATCPVLILLNKIDVASKEAIELLEKAFSERFPKAEIHKISALEKKGVEGVFERLEACLPIGPVYYPKEQFTDRPERFFVSEIIREKILLLYHQEIPYSCEVGVDSFKEDTEKDLIHIHATIYVGRKTQKPIIIGKAGSAIKKLGTQARIDIEKFLEKRVFLQLYVRIKEGWRDNDKMLNRFGY